MLYTPIPNTLNTQATVIAERNLRKCAKPLDIKPTAVVLLRFPLRLIENTAVEPANEMTCASWQLYLNTHA